MSVSTMSCGVPNFHHHYYHHHHHHHHLADFSTTPEHKWRGRVVSAIIQPSRLAPSACSVDVSLL